MSASSSSPSPSLRPSSCSTAASATTGSTRRRQASKRAWPALFFTMFAIHTATSRAPLFDPATFRDRNFAVGTALALIMGMLQYGPMVLFPPLLQELQGYPEALIGYLIASRGLGNLGSFFIVAQLTRLSPRLCLALGLSDPGGRRPVDGLLRHANSLRTRDVEQHAARFRLRPQLHADGGACLLDHAHTLPDARQRHLRTDPHAGLERVRVADPGGVRPLDGRGQSQPGELDHPFQPRPHRALDDSTSAISATATSRPAWPPRSSARPAWSATSTPFT